MQVIERTHIEENKATINHSDFLQNTYTAKDLTIHNIWGRSVGGSKTYIWVIIGSTAILALLIGSFFLYKLHIRIQGIPEKDQDKTSSENSTLQLRTTGGKKKYSYEEMALEQMMDNPFQLRGHTTAEPTTEPPAYSEDTRLMEIQRINREKREWMQTMHQK